MSKPGACVRCKEPVTNQSLLTCCEQPCHVACATQWRKSRGIYSDCFHCSQWRCFALIEVLNEEWKEDPKFVEEVKRIWHHHPLWYGICYEFTGTIQKLWEGKQGFWGTLDDVADGNTTTIFLGHTQSEVIANMKPLNAPPMFPMRTRPSP